MALSEKLKTKAATTATPPPAGELHLYIDSYPVKGVAGPVVLLDDLIAARQSAVADQFGAKDVRLVAYNEGKNAMAADFAANPPTGIVYASSSAVASPVIEALVPVAKVVVRPMR